MPEFISPDIILTGQGCLKELGRQAAEYGQSATIVIGCSAGLAGGRLDEAKQLLASSGLRTDVFSGAKPEPPCEQVDHLRQHLRAKRSEIVIAIGGGSAIDLAKAAAILCKSDKSVEEHVATQKLPSESLPLIAVPTTAGSGSEATPTAVLTDTIANVKRSIRARIMMPKVAIIDPELTCSCPPRLTAVVGMDALTQAIESYCSTLATNLTEALCEKAIVLISQNLERAYRDGSDLAARTALAEGSLLAGMALANARLVQPFTIKVTKSNGMSCLWPM
jgi:alcohol dehydrogenase class IV